MNTPFDFEQHRIRSLERFGSVRERYVRYANALEAILQMALREIPTHNISARAKDLKRFADKAAKPNPENTNLPKYADPLSEIEDLAGARIIAYVLRALPDIESVVQREFDVFERSDKADKLLENGSVGYRSIHLIVQMKPQRAQLLEYSEFAGMRAEVQIRTILQHAWAEIEHDMRYKPTAEPNMQLSQRFTALAGLIEVGDREFDQIYEIDERRRRGLRDLAQYNEEISDRSDKSSTLKDRVENQLPTVAGSDNTGFHLFRTLPPQPRQLIALERYADAIIAYNALIAAEPKQFAHFLGRAKARFLSGDVAGAIVDIAEAERLSPSHPFVARVRDLIEGKIGDVRPTSDQSLAVRHGHTALRDGDATLALTKYEEAEGLGFSPVFSVFNRAMAQFLDKRYDVARQTLERVDPYPGSAFEFNVTVLRTLCYLMSGGEQREEALELVKNLLSKMMSALDYKYNARSPLVDLEKGVRKVFSEKEIAIALPIFVELSRADDTK